ncbi:hypothetical protein ES708_22310 [subsurface metagenome]
MTQKALTPEKIAELRSLRSQGLTLRAVATKTDVSLGAVSNHTRDIPIPARRTQSQKDGPKSQAEVKDTTAGVVAGPYDEETKELANKVKKARLQAELDDISDQKRQRQETDELRIRERKLSVQLEEARTTAGRGDGSSGSQFTELRNEIAELREARHQAELRESDSRHQAEIRRLEGQIDRIGQTGLTEFDLMGRWGDKLENLIILGSGKVDRAISQFQSANLFKTALSMGISPAEMDILNRGPLEIPTIEEFQLGRQLSAHRAGVPLTEPGPGEYKALVARIESENKQYETAMAKAQQGAGAPKTTRTSSLGKTPAPGEPEPPVLQAESRLVTCSRCQTTFDIDLAEARQSVAAGKRLFLPCANPKCGFLLDISELLGLKLTPEGPAPECFEATPKGCAARVYNYENCRDCQWRDFPSTAKE